MDSAAHNWVAATNNNSNTSSTPHLGHIHTLALAVKAPACPKGARQQHSSTGQVRTKVKAPAWHVDDARSLKLSGACAPPTAAPGCGLVVLLALTATEGTHHQPAAAHHSGWCASAALA
jgi:hypothetical protein